MDSKELILARLEEHQPGQVPLPDMTQLGVGPEGSAEKFRSVLEAIGGKLVEITGPDALVTILADEYSSKGRIVSPIPFLAEVAENIRPGSDPHTLEDVVLAVVPGQFGVAENAAVWVTGEEAGGRALPFIAEHLAVVIQKKDILPTMHDAYTRIGNSEYGFGVFIAGPSKTADIEQSLVLGAHGPKSMTVFVLAG